MIACRKGVHRLFEKGVCQCSLVGMNVPTQTSRIIGHKRVVKDTGSKFHDQHTAHRVVNGGHVQDAGGQCVLRGMKKKGEKNEGYI